jgi:hypothetical protein
LREKNNGIGQPMTTKSKSKGFPHLEEDFIGGVVDLDLLFQFPQNIQES